MQEKVLNLRIAAAAAIIKNKKILMSKRGEEEIFPEYWTFPGGLIKKPGEALSKVVVREVKEEMGLKFKPTRQFGFYELITENFHNISHVFLGEFSGKIKIDEKEVSEARWFTYAEAIKQKLAFSYREVIEEHHKEELI